MTRGGAQQSFVDTKREPSLSREPSLRSDSEGQEILLLIMKTAFRVAAQGGHILFLGSTEKTKHLAMEAARESCQYFMDHWVPGALANLEEQFKEFKTIESRLSHDDRHLPAPAVRRLRQRQRLLQKLFRGIGEGTERPKLVFVFDAVSGHAAIEEAKGAGIPVAAIVPDGSTWDVTYALPSGHTNSSFYAHMIARAARDGIAWKIGYEGIGSVDLPHEDEGSMLGTWDSWRDDAKSTVVFGEDAEGPFYKLRPDAFGPSEKLMELVYSTFENPALVGHRRQELRRRTKSLVAPRILEVIASRARRTAAGVLPNVPLAIGGELNAEFVSEMQANLPFKQGKEFYKQLCVELTSFLGRGGRISGTWGKLLLNGNQVEFDLAKRSEPRPDTDWERASVEWG